MKMLSLAQRECTEPRRILREQMCLEPCNTRAEQMSIAPDHCQLPILYEDRVFFLNTARAELRSEICAFPHDWGSSWETAGPELTPWRRNSPKDRVPHSLRMKRCIFNICLIWLRCKMSLMFNYLTFLYCFILLLWAWDLITLPGLVTSSWAQESLFT